MTKVGIIHPDKDLEYKKKKYCRMKIVIIVVKSNVMNILRMKINQCTGKYYIFTLNLLFIQVD